ncbi:MULTISPECIES: hypothetical protein [Streptomyces]|uniref:hypothetical protein n=1 Tax=Streptomyces TaxID=1883 RepID=UPI0029A575CF|nr:hypothetical protein [Streptomyces sp. ME02-6978.2a]MDX3362106.1 hypothetical protein [Streptomyces sp. ME02-6978.2a]
MAEDAAAKVLREDANTIPGARAAGCRLAPEGEGTDVRVTMTLAAAPDRPLPDRVRQVRRSVLDSAALDLGLAMTAVDLTVLDVTEPWPRPRDRPSRLAVVPDDRRRWDRAPRRRGRGHPRGFPA